MKQERYMFQILVILLSLLIGYSSFADEVGYVTANSGLRVRKEATSRSRRLMTLRPGAKFKVIERNGKWTKIETENGPGYVYNKYIRTEVVEGTTCTNCESDYDEDATQPVPSKNRRTLQDALRFDEKSMGASSDCLTERMFNALETVRNRPNKGKNNFGNNGSKRLKGKCGYAMRNALYVAGIKDVNVGIGNAKDMIPGLEAAGFKNIMKFGMTPYNAPNNTILVYGKKLRGAEGCRGKGSVYGHIEFKRSDEEYLSDGVIPHPIHSWAGYGTKCRPLIGVMQMTNDCPMCKTEAKVACGVKDAE